MKAELMGEIYEGDPTLPIGYVHRMTDLPVAPEEGDQLLLKLWINPPGWEDELDLQIRVIQVQCVITSDPSVDAYIQVWFQVDTLDNPVFEWFHHNGWITEQLVDA